MEELIYTRTAPSGKILMSRWLAMVFYDDPAGVPDFFLHAFSVCFLWEKSGCFCGLSGISSRSFSDGFLPEILMVSSLGMFFTELTGSPLLS